MPDAPNANPKPNRPVKVDEPDNTRPSDEPTPRAPQKPQQAEGADETDVDDTPDREGM